MAQLMAVITLLLHFATTVRAANVPAHCFEETTAYGRAVDYTFFGTTVTDKTSLDGIDFTVFGDYPRVSLLKFCTAVTTGYLQSVQAAISNGVATETKWLQSHGDLDSADDSVECTLYELEQNYFRVNTLEIGYLDQGDVSSTQKGVIWLRFMLRDLRGADAGDSDVTINVGRSEPSMLKNTLKFT